MDETPTISLKVSLMDEDGVFLEFTPIVKPIKEMGEDLTLRLTEAEQKNAELQVELAGSNLPSSRRKLLGSLRR